MAHWEVSMSQPEAGNCLSVASVGHSPCLRVACYSTTLTTHIIINDISSFFFFLRWVLLIVDPHCTS